MLPQNKLFGILNGLDVYGLTGQGMQCVKGCFCVKGCVVWFRAKSSWNMN